MDWYAWLSRTGLAPSLTHEYGRLFSRNELEPDDAAHFDHDLLKSMGIAVAKHRLEILKLARKQAAAEAGEGASAAAARLARRATRCLARCVRRLASGGGGGRRGASSVTVVPRIYGDDAGGAVQKKCAIVCGCYAVRHQVICGAMGGATSRRGLPWTAFIDACENGGGR